MSNLKKGILALSFVIAAAVANAVPIKSETEQPQPKQEDKTDVIGIIEFDFCGTPVGMSLFLNGDLSYYDMRNNAKLLVWFDNIVNKIIAAGGEVPKVDISHAAGIECI